MKLLMENWRGFLNEGPTVPADIKTIIKNLLDKPELGHGNNAQVWAIPDTDLVFRAEPKPQRSPSRIKNYKNYLDNPDYQVEMIPGDGTGLVAKIGPHITILKLKRGVAATGASVSRTGGGSTQTEDSIRKFKEAIVLAASMTDEAYKKVIEKMVKLEKNGIAIDPSNPSNILIDKKNEEFNFVDLKKSDNARNYGDHIAVMLVQPNEFSATLTDDKEAVKAAKIILDKLKRAIDQNQEISVHNPRALEPWFIEAFKPNKAPQGEKSEESFFFENWRGFLNEVKLADYQAQYKLRADALGFGKIIPKTAKIKPKKMGALTGLAEPPPPKLTITILNGNNLNIEDTTKQGIITLVNLAGRAGGTSGSGFLNDYMNGELLSGDVFEITTATERGTVYILCQIEAQEGFWNLNIMGSQIRTAQFDTNNKLYTIV